MLHVKFGKDRLHGFRGDVVWKCWRTTDERRMPAYTTSSPVSLWLRWAKNHLHINKTEQNMVEKHKISSNLLQTNAYKMRSKDFGNWFTNKKFEPPRDKTNKMTVCPAKTQISLGIRPVWSESSLCTQWVAKDQSFLHADSEDSDQTGRMPRLIWVFAGRTTTLLVLSWGSSFMTN